MKNNDRKILWKVLLVLVILFVLWPLIRKVFQLAILAAIGVVIYGLIRGKLS